jgi:rhodanese-related sulfurtransferase
MTQTAVPTPSAPPAAPTIDAQTASAWLAAGQALLVDVREPAEFASEHIAGATLLPLSKFDPTQLPDAPGRKLVMQCHRGTRARQACAQLTPAQRTSAWVLDGGIEGWKQAGLPTVQATPGKSGMDVQRQTQFTIGALVLLGTLLGAFVSPWFLLLPGIIGCGLIFAGVTGTCMLALLLARLPWNQRGHGACGAGTCCH